MNQTNWFCITGASCSGKTTTINLLKTIPKKIVVESARYIILEGIKNGCKPEKIIEDIVEFQGKVLQHQHKLAKSLNPKEEVFWDRGFPDTYGFIKARGKDPSIYEALYHSPRFKKIFFLEMLPYETDKERVEDLEFQKKVETFILQKYQELNYKIIMVPVMSPTDRVDFILNHL